MDLESRILRTRFPSVIIHFFQQSIPLLITDWRKVINMINLIGFHNDLMEFAKANGKTLIRYLLN